MKRLTTFLAATPLVGAMGAGTARADEYKIGLIADFTGIFSTWGPQFLHAIKAFQAIHGASARVKRSRFPSRISPIRYRV